MRALGEFGLGDDLGVGDGHDAQAVGVGDVHVVAVGLDDVALVDADLLGVRAGVVLPLHCAGRSSGVGADSAASSVAAMSPSAITRPSP